MNNSPYTCIVIDRPTYKAYKNMIYRCTNSLYPRFKDYGGRGIMVCDKWLIGYENFLSDMGERPSSEYSIDRIDNDGNYTPENCRWTTRNVQMTNKRQTIVHNPLVILDVVNKLNMGVSVKEIAKNSPMSQGGIYHYKEKIKAK